MLWCLALIPVNIRNKELSQPKSHQKPETPAASPARAKYSVSISPAPASVLPSFDSFLQFSSLFPKTADVDAHRPDGWAGYQVPGAVPVSG